MKLETRNWKLGLAGIAILLMAACGKRVESLPLEGFTTHATLSAQTLTVGDPVSLTLTARHPAGSTVRFPTLGNGKKIVVRERSQETQQLTEDIQESEELYQLTSFRVGNWKVTTHPVVCTFADGTEKTQALPELTLQVQSSLNATNATRLSDIKDIVKPPLRLSPKLLWVLLFIALLALIAGLLTIAFKRKSHAHQQLPPPLPPHQLARQALDALRAKPWSPEPFFTELSVILRTYLENRFSLNAPESTTEELTREMAHDVRLNIKEQQTLRNFMTQADLVKFARADAEGDVMRSAFSTVEEFVEQTKENQTDSIDPSDQTDLK